MRKSNPAFTLIELLIAILIFSIIASVVYSTFSTGTSVWKRTKNATGISMNINSVLEDLARDLRCAVAYKGLEFIGEEGKLYFCCLSDTITDEGRYTEVYRASYYLSPDAKSGKFDLFKRKAPLIKGGFNIDETLERELIDSLDDFKIEYAYKETMGEIIWKEEWEGTEEADIPKGIRIEISKEDVKLTKYILIPTGELVSPEAD